MHRVGDELDRLVLADHPVVEDLVEPQQLVALALDQAGDRDAGPAGDDLGHLVFGDLLAHQRSALLLVARLRLGLVQRRLELGELAVLELGRPVEVVVALGDLDLPAHLLDLLAQAAHLVDRFALLLPLGAHGVRLPLQVGQLLAQRLEALLRRLVLLLLERRLLDLELHHPAGDLVELGRHRVDLGAHHGRGLVDQVDRLVRQEAVGDVAVRQHRGGDDGVVLDAHAVVDLVALLESPEDGDRVLDRRRLDDHRLEAALERGVLLDVFAVLVEGRGADAVELAPGEHRLEQVAGVGGAFGAAGADDVVELVDEQQHAAVALLDLGEHRLEPLLELAPVLGAGQERPHVEGEDRPVFEPVRHVAADDALGQTLDDRRLADARLADQHRVVLGLARQDPDRPADLGVTADHRVELAALRLGHQVDAVLLERLVGGLRGRAGHPLRAADLGQDLQEPVPGDPVTGEQAPGGGAVPGREEGEDQVLDRDVLVLEPLRLVLGVGQDLLQPLGDVDLARLGTGTADRRASLELLLEAGGQRGGVHVHAREQAGDQPLGLLEQGEQQVLGGDLLMAVAQRLGLRRLERLLGLVGQLAQIHGLVFPVVLVLVIGELRTSARSPRSPGVVRRACVPRRRAPPARRCGTRRRDRRRPPWSVGSPCRAAAPCGPTTCLRGS